jgi:hypothetical protein
MKGIASGDEADWLIDVLWRASVLPSADTAAMLFRALLASGQINVRKVDGWPSRKLGVNTPAYNRQVCRRY